MCLSVVHHQIQIIYNNILALAIECLHSFWNIMYRNGNRTVFRYLAFILAIIFVFVCVVCCVTLVTWTHSCVMIVCILYKFLISVFLKEFFRFLHFYVKWMNHDNKMKWYGMKQQTKRIYTTLLMI